MSRSFLYPTTATVSVIVCLGMAATGHAVEKLYVQTPAIYGKHASVNEKMKQECGVEDKVSQYVQESAKSKFDVVPSKTLDNAGGNKALTLTILGVQGIGGGPYSGAKGIILQGTLKENGKVIGTFNAQRNSTGGAFIGYKSTCSILERCAKTLGKDIAAWLAQPSMNAKLGEM